MPPKPDPSDPRTWELGDVVSTTDFATEKDGKKELKFNLDAGLYRAVVETKDRFGKEVSAKLQIRVLKPETRRLVLKIPNLFVAPKWTLEPGQEFMALWGTGYDKGRAFIEVEHRGKIAASLLDRSRQDAGQGQAGDRRRHARRLHGARHVRS